MPEYFLVKSANPKFKFSIHKIVNGEVVAIISLDTTEAEAQEHLDMLKARPQLIDWLEQNSSYLKNAKEMIEILKNSKI